MMLAFEHRWCRALFDSLLPSSSMPGIATLSLDKFWDDFARRAPPLMKLGLRCAIYYLTLRPIFSFKYHRLFSSLSPAMREEFLTKSNESPFYFERQLVTTLKAVACMAYFDNPEIRLMVE